MASVVGGKVKLSNGTLVTPQQGGWYDGQQFWGGALSNPGQINAQSNQQGAGQQVSAEVNKQTSVAAGLAPDANQNFINAQTAAGVTGTPAGTGAPSGGGSGISAGVGGGGTGGGLGIGAAQPIDLLGQWQQLQQSSGIKGLQDQIDAQTAAYDKANSIINDNPFLSESIRVGRGQKLATDYQNATSRIQDQIKIKQADNDMQMQLAQKQYDINSQAAQTAMNQFNTLLSSGALNNANGDDIANLVRSTGMSSNMIQSAISATAQKNKQTQVISFDDGTNQGFAVIDPTTGEIISKQVVAGSKVLGTAEDKQIGKGGSGAVSAAANKSEALQQLPIDLKNKMTLGTAMSFYEQFGLTPQQIYNQYKVSGVYNPTAAQQKADQKKYNVK